VSIAALNRWRVVYLLEVLLVAGMARRSRWLRRTVLLGAALWCLHDAAHGRWRTLLADGVALAGGVRGGLAGRLLALLAVASAVARPEREPSPHLWSTVRH